MPRRKKVIVYSVGEHLLIGWIVIIQQAMGKWTQHTD